MIHKLAVIFAIFNAVIISLLVFIVEALRLDSEFGLVIWLAVAVFSIIMGYLISKENLERPFKEILKASVIGALLLLLNPYFWGGGSGHPPLPNALGIPIYFLFMFIPGIIGMKVCDTRGRKP